MSDARAKLNSSTVEALANIRVVKSFSTEEKEAKHYTEKVEEMLSF